MSSANYIDSVWDDSIVPSLIEYIRIPAKSPHFDKNWKENGYLHQAAQFALKWVKEFPIQRMVAAEMIELEGKTPVLYIEIAGSEGAPKDSAVLLYGHLDKQPEMKGWEAGKGPWIPVYENGKLYGRGGADDGYAVFASLLSIAALQREGKPHPRCVILVETCEESGSVDLPAYLSHLKARIGPLELVVCLDSGCADYERMWVTTSLRGLFDGKLTIKVLENGIHSGSGSGVVPSAMGVLRQLMDRVENVNTGAVQVQECHVTIPQSRRDQMGAAAKLLGDGFVKSFPWVAKMKPFESDPAELILRRTWKPALSVIGLEGYPNHADAGNVVIPEISVKISMRLPPGCDPKKAAQGMKDMLEKDPPHGAQVTFDFDPEGGAVGWSAPEEEKWLLDSLSAASKKHFSGNDVAYIGEGGTIPFMGMLGREFPSVQFVITGVLGPNSNAHGPNEFLHVPFAKRLTHAVADILVDTYNHTTKKA